MWSVETLTESLLIGSTLVEGSTLSEREAEEVLAGRTVVGHPAYEARELINYRGALIWLMEQVAAYPYMSLDLIQGFHARLFNGLGDTAGRLKTSANYTFGIDGKRVTFVKPAEVRPALVAWLERYNDASCERGVTVGQNLVRAARHYHDFEMIHPFADGNGRIGRILLAYWLHWKTGKTFSFYVDDKIEHLRAMQAATAGDLDPLVALITRCVAGGVRSSMDAYGTPKRRAHLGRTGLSDSVDEKLIAELRRALQAGSFKPLTFEQCMTFLLSDGVFGDADLPVAQFLALEDWARRQNEPTFSATELKNKTGTILRLVAAGQKVAIKKHGKVVCRVTPP